MPEQRIVMICLAGLALIAAVGLERVLKRFPVSVPMVYVGVGWVAFSLPLGLPTLDPAGDLRHSQITEYLTEFIVIVSLMAAGLAIDRPARWKLWRQVWPLLGITMPLTIALTAFAGWSWLALTPAAAILLGAAMSPTDPVLADAVQVHPPGESDRHDVRFTLTVEAGINDSLAFPFTYLAIAAIGAAGVGAWTLEWFAVDVLWRLFAGGGVGYAVGRATAWYVFAELESGEREEDSPKALLRQRKEGFVALGAVLASYGIAEIVEGYGFLAVFVAAVAMRQRELVGGYHSMMHRFVDQIEQMTMMLMMIGFGGLIASGILAPLTVEGALIGILVVFLVRPLTGVIAQRFHSPLPWLGRSMIAFAGIRGIGSIYYLSYGQNHGNFGNLDVVWAIISFVVLVSIVVHGMTVAFCMRYVERQGAHIPEHAEDAHV